MTSIEIGLEPEGEEGGYDDESSVANESLSGALQDLADPNKNDKLLNLNEDENLKEEDKITGIDLISTEIGFGKEN